MFLREGGKKKIIRGLKYFPDSIPPSAPKGISKKTQWHNLLHIYFNRTIHVIKYLHAGKPEGGEGGRGARSDRCGHNIRNQALPCDQRQVSPRSHLLFVRGV